MNIGIIGCGNISDTYFEKILKEGKTLKILTVGSKGHDQLKRVYGKYIIESINFKGFKKITYKEA